MDVRSAVAQPLGDEQVHDLDRRRVRGDAGELERRDAIEPHLRPRFLQRSSGHLKPRPHAVDTAEVGQDVGGARDVGQNGQPGEKPDVVHDRHIARVAHRDGQVAVVAPERQHHVTAGKVFGQRPGHLGVDIAVLQACDRGPQVKAEHMRQPVFVHRPLLDQDCAQWRQSHSLIGESAAELFLADQAFSDQDLPEALLGRSIARPCVVELEHALMFGVIGSFGNGNCPTTRVICPRRPRPRASAVQSAVSPIRAAHSIASVRLLRSSFR